MPKFKFKQVNYTVVLGATNYVMHVCREDGTTNYFFWFLPQDKFVWYLHEACEKENPEYWIHKGTFYLRPEKGMRWSLWFEFSKNKVKLVDFNRFPNWAVNHEC